MDSIELGKTGIFGALILFGAYQGYALSFVFWQRRRGDALSNRLLALLILLITLHLSEIFLDVAGLLPRFPHLSAATFPLVFLLGPVFYLYLRRVSGDPLRFRPIWLAHLVPAIAVVVTVAPWYGAPAEIKAAYHASRSWGGHTELDLRTYVLLFVNVIQNLAYAGFGQRLIRRRERELSELSSDNDLVAGLSSLRRVARAFSLYAGGYLLLFTALLIWGKYTAEVDTVWLVLIALFLQVLGYSAINLPETFEHSLPSSLRPDENGGSPATPSSGRGKYAKASLSPERSREIFESVLELMRSDRLYLSRELKLSDVARRLRVSLHHLSQAINREGEESFLELVNRHRVEEAKRLLEDPKKASLTVLAIGYESGFNNKASFNAAFKRFTGTTPSSWRKGAVA